jgi:hypothetical protein
MKYVLFMILLIINEKCSTIFSKPDTRVSPICEWREKKKGDIKKNITDKNKLISKEENFSDFELISLRPLDKKSKLYMLHLKILDYYKTLENLLETGVALDDISNIKNTLLDRIDSIHLNIANSYEKEGDDYYSQYNFSKALESYMDSEATIQEMYNEKKQKAALEKIERKIQLTREVGENFLQNKIKSYVDQANYLYLDDQNKKAKEAMKLALNGLEESVLVNAKTISIYNDQAIIMKLDVFQNSNCTKVHSTDRYSLKKKIGWKVNPTPASFTTKSGLKFDKIIRKDGKPIFVSEVIRRDESDSWYYARDFAEKLNVEENCKKCYKLPEYEDIENVVSKSPYKDDSISSRGVDIYEGAWLNSWSPAPVGVTYGNIFLFYYTFDYLHDVVTHPLTWKSYVYFISPDSVILNNKNWKYIASTGRTLSRTILAQDPSLSIPVMAVDKETKYAFNLGFRIVRPIE